MGLIVNFLTGGYRAIQTAKIMEVTLSEVVSLAQSYKKAALLWPRYVSCGGAATLLTATFSCTSLIGRQASSSDQSKRHWTYLLVGSLGLSAVSLIFYLCAKQCVNDLNFLREKCKDRLIEELFL